jgi:hypothetical protein
MIDTRQELLIALRAAAELEQVLMVQYLYAGMTLKNSSDDSLSDSQQSLVRSWRRDIYEVAREEMGHLGTVQNIMVGVGGPPYFEMPSLPRDANHFEGKKFSLEPLTLKTIQRFVAFEAPEEDRRTTRALAPDPLRFRTVGSLYQQIADGIESLGDEVAFISPSTDQDVTNWSSSVEVHQVTSVETAKAAIQDIVEEGEGTTVGGEGSHYQVFLQIENDYKEELERDASFQPYRSVLDNPTVFQSRENATEFTSKEAKELAVLFNSVYTTMLIGLSQYYKFQDKPDFPVDGFDTQRFLRTTLLAGLMKGVIRPLGQDVLPFIVNDEDAKTFASPPFEQFMPPDAPWNRRSTWIILLERLKSEAAYARARIAMHPRIERIADSLESLADNVEELQG